MFCFNMFDVFILESLQNAKARVASEVTEALVTMQPIGMS